MLKRVQHDGQGGGHVMILIACGLQREARILAGPGIVAIPGGGDGARLEALLEAQAAGAAMIVSAGIAGALDPSLGAGDVVLHLPPFETNGWGERLRILLPRARHGTVLGQDHIAATVAEKAALYTATGALAVDMESHIAARVAARHNLPFAAIRTISDTAQASLPPAALVGMNPDGSMALGKVLVSLARRPAQLPALIRTGRSAEAAFLALEDVAVAIAALTQRMPAESGAGASEMR
ncbi:MAG: phosphorylase [Sphingomonas sp.]|nr:phosphorylase [Sphingomonas sp.]